MNSVARAPARDCVASPRCATCAGSSPARSAPDTPVASSTALARSSARPWPILARKSAVQGATTTRSVSRASRIWPTSNSLLAIEQVGVDAPAGQRARRQRRDEFLRRLGHHHAHRRAALAQPPDEVERLVGGDAAGDDQNEPPAQPARRLLPARSAAPPDLIAMIAESAGVSVSDMARIRQNMADFLLHRAIIGGSAQLQALFQARRAGCGWSGWP